MTSLVDDDGGVAQLLAYYFSIVAVCGKQISLLLLCPRRRLRYRYQKQNSISIISIIVQQIDHGGAGRQPLCYCWLSAPKCYTLQRHIEGLNVSGHDARIADMDEDWAETLGRAISKNICLRRLTLGEGFLRSHALSLSSSRSLFLWIVHNRSIEHLHVKIEAEMDDDIIQIFTPLVELNTNLRCIEITRSGFLSERTSSHISTFTNYWKNSSLARVCLRENGIGDMQAATLLNAMTESREFHNLLELDLVENLFGREACEALCALLKNTECRLHSLILSSDSITNECMGILVSGFAASNTLKILELLCEGGRVTQTGWRILFSFFSSHMCLLEKVMLSGIGFVADESAATLGNSLASNRIMNSLTIFTRISAKGCQEFSRCLRSPYSNLTELDLSESIQDDTGAVEIFRALVNNTTLKKLVLTDNYNISSSGWATCFRQLTGSQSALEELYFDSCYIDDEGVNILVNLLSRQMDTVRRLDIQYNRFITADGWRLLADVLLPNSTSSLETLQIGSDADIEEETQMNDDTALSFITALSNNSSLVEMHICYVKNVSQSSLDALVQVLCDESSIESVCNSNHTLSNFQYNTCNNNIPEHQRIELDLLKLNKCKDKAEVVRKKILTSSVINEDTVVHEFGLMPVTIFPSLMEWIGRDRLGYSAMHCLVQSFPSLFGQITGPDADESVTLESPRKLRKVE